MLSTNTNVIARTNAMQILGKFLKIQLYSHFVQNILSSEKSYRIASSKTFGNAREPACCKLWVLFRVCVCVCVRACVRVCVCAVNVVHQHECKHADQRPAELSVFLIDKLYPHLICSKLWPLRNLAKCCVPIRMQTRGWARCTLSIPFITNYISNTCHYYTTEPLIIGLFCCKWPLKIRHLMIFVK